MPSDDGAEVGSAREGAERRVAALEARGEERIGDGGGRMPDEQRSLERESEPLRGETGAALVE